MIFVTNSLTSHSVVFYVLELCFALFVVGIEWRPLLCQHVPSWWRLGQWCMLA